MNQLQAMKDTMELARFHMMDMIQDEDKPDRDYGHLMDMLRNVISEPDAFSEAKLGRWLGWMQACVYGMCENVTLDDMKEINERNK